MGNSPFISEKRPVAPVDAWAEVRPEIGEFERHRIGDEKGAKAYKDFRLETTNAILSRFFGGGDVTEGKAYLLADGVGSGKTTAVLDAAVQVNNQTDLASLIVVKDELSIAQGVEKAKSLGIDLDSRKISYCTYEELADRLQNAKPGDLGLVACDEAHVLTVSENQKACEAMKKFEGFQLYVTATATGSLENVLLFEELIHKKPPAQTASELGLVPELEGDKPTGKYVVEDPDKFMDKMEGLQQEMAAEGAMSKMEYPLWGSITSKMVSNDSTTEEIKFPKAQLTIARQLEEGGVNVETVLTQIRALSEYAMAEKVADDIIGKISKGEAVILYANYQPVPCEALKDEPFNGKIPSAAEVIKEHVMAACKQDKDLAKKLGIIVELKNPEPSENYNSQQMNDVFQAKHSALAILPPSLSEGINGLCEMDKKNPRKTSVFVAGFDPDLPLGPCLVQMYGRAFRNKAESPSEGRVYFMEGSISDEMTRNELSSSLRMLHVSGSGVAEAIRDTVERVGKKEDLTVKQAKRVQSALELITDASEKMEAPSLKK